MSTDPSPLVGALDIDLTSKSNLSIGPGLAQLEQALSWTIQDIDRIPRFKILFNGKRVSMEIVIAHLVGMAERDRHEFSRIGCR